MWEISVNDQILTFLYSLVLGILLCIFYDVLRAIRKTGSSSYFSVLAGDIIFWIVNSFVTFIFLLSRTNGEIRGYVLVSMLLGFIVCRLTFSKLIFSVLVAVIGFVRRILSRIIGVINGFTDKTASIITKFTEKIIKIIKKLLKNRK